MCVASSRPSYRLEDILALNAEIISLSRVELPLDPHLGRMSKELSGRLRRLGEDLAQRIHAGQSLDEAIEELGTGFPPMYRAVVTAGLRSGRLTSALEDIAATARRIQKVRISYLTASVYPAIILILTGVFGATIGMEQLHQMRTVCETSFIPADSHIYTAIDFFLALRPMFLALIPIGTLMLLLIALLQVWPSSLFLGNGIVPWLLPGARKIARNCQWAMVFDLMGLLLKHQCPLPEAVRLATAATGSRKMTASGKEWADRIEKGDVHSAPAELTPISRWLLASKLEPDALAESLALAGQRYFAQARRQSLWIQNQLPIYATLGIGGIVVVLYALMLFIPWISILRYVLIPAN
ncbi:type II secretion system F family protein [Bremerella sp. JC817]|uniref:type II secretion system F family protein n=1 Tax=Bremerella sp. JC817 TaxID=3231756 RepID=UPI00345A41E5